MNLTDLLNEIERLDKASTKGPWQWRDSTKTMTGNFIPMGDSGTYSVVMDWFDDPHASAGPAELKNRDAEFIAFARTALPLLALYVKRCREVLQPFADSADWAEAEAEAGRACGTCDGRADCDYRIDLGGHEKDCPYAKAKEALEWNPEEASAAPRESI